MLELQATSIIKQVCIGANRYTSARGQAMYINCLESYQVDDNSIGEYAVQHRCSFDDFKFFEGKNKPSFSTPMVVTAEGKFEVFAGTKQFSISSIVSVTPYKTAVLEVELQEPEPGAAHQVPGTESPVVSTPTASKSASKINK